MDGDTKYLEFSIPNSSVDSRICSHFISHWIAQSNCSIKPPDFDFETKYFNVPFPTVIYIFQQQNESVQRDYFMEDIFEDSKEKNEKLWLLKMNK